MLAQRQQGNDSAEPSEHSEQSANPKPSEQSEEQEAEAKERRAISVRVVHEAIRREGEEELSRTSAALAWSGLAAGLSMGFSLTGEGLLRAHLPDADWRPLVAKLGYSLGFLIVILGRQQLFTENTLTVILPLLNRACRLRNVLRLWAIVLASNLVGALLFAAAACYTEAFSPPVRDAFAGIARESAASGFGGTLLHGIFAGWLIALIVWLQPGAETARVPIIILLTWVIGVAGFSHVVAGAIEVFYGALAGVLSWPAALGGYLIPALLGNILGGVALVALLNHAQVATDTER